MKVIGKKKLYDLDSSVEVLLIGNSGPKDRNFVKVFHAFLEDVAGDPEIAGKSIRLLLYMLRHLDYNTLLINFSIEDAIKELRITKRTYFSWVKILVKKGILQKLAPSLFRLGAGYAIRGTMSRIPDSEFQMSLALGARSTK